MTTSQEPENETDTVSADQRDEVIDRLYEVAIDPTRYEDLLDHWESLIRPIREGANGTVVDSRIDTEFAAHFNRADKLLRHLEVEPPGGPGENPLSRIEKSAAFMIGRDLKFVDVNKAGVAVLNIRNGGALADLPIEPEDLQPLSDLIQQILNGNSDGTRIFRARALKNSRLIIFQLQVLRAADADPVVVAVTSELSWPEGFGSILKSAFGLTEAEGDVVRALTECQSLREIAEVRQRSVETVRAQMRAILSKTETRSQTELVRLVLSMMDITSFSENAAARARPCSEGFETLEPRAFQTLTLHDGRRMDYLVLGDPAGRPCLYMPLDYGLVRWPASAEAEAARRHIQVIVPVRPGYGDSSPMPRSYDLGTIVAQDIAALLDHLKVPRCPALTLGSDIFYIAHFHHLFRDRLTAVIACAGTLPLSRGEQYQRMGKWHRFILASARYTPHLLPFMVKAGFLLARRIGKRGFIHAVYGESPADVATFEDPEVFEAIVCGSEVTLSETRSAHRAFAHEVTVQESSDWAPLIREMRDSVPLHYINGLQDPQVPAETLREFQDDYPWIEFHIHKHAGQLIFFLKWREALDLLEKYLPQNRPA